MDPSVKDLFDAVAGDYDRERRQLIPCFDDFYGMALSLVESDHPSPRILDLGAGTGLFSGMVLHKHPHARLTLMDLKAPAEDSQERIRSAILPATTRTIRSASLTTSSSPPCRSTI